MRTTGIAVAAAGLLMALFAGLLAPMFQHAPNPADASNLNVPVVFGVAAMVVGAALFLFGDRSYVASQNPAVRN